MAKKTINVNGTTWTGTSKKDKVYIKADNVSVNTGAGNDSIKNDHNYAWWSTINAGNGNDTITFDSAEYSSINAGAGNDIISLSGGYYLTVKGGTGDDTIYGYGTNMFYQYASGDGNDVIYGIDAGDTLKITGAKYTRSTVGSDVIIGVGNSSITLSGAADRVFEIQGNIAGGKNIIYNDGLNVKINGGTGNKLR